MSGSKIPTAEAFLYQQLKEAGFTEDYIRMMFRLNKDSTSSYIECLQNFAKLHVEAALKAASENAMLLGIGIHKPELRDSQESVFVEDPNGPDFTYMVDKESILSAYPLENIK